jgi:16S rRNA (guanine1207-N2)-methyltransferase
VSPIVAIGPRCAATTIREGIVSVSLLDEARVILPPAYEALYRAVWPSADLLAETAPFSAGTRTLLLGCAADPLCLVVARRVKPTECVVVDDDAAAGTTLMALAASARLTNLRAAEPVEFAAECAAADVPRFTVAIANTLYHPSKRMTMALLALAHAALSPGGTLYVAGAKSRGIVSVAEEVRRLFGASATLVMRKGHRVVAATRGSEPGDDPSGLFSLDAAAEPVVVRGQPLTLVPSPLVFAGGRLDPATKLLAEAMEVYANDVVADLGCGAGIVGLVAARLAPAGHVYLLDASHTSVRLAAENARRNSIVNVTAVAGDAITALGRKDIRPQVIVTNPPFHTGQAQSRLVAQEFFAGAARRLAPGGRCYVVANRFLPYERELRQHFAIVREIAGDERYKVLGAEQPVAQAD